MDWLVLAHGVGNAEDLPIPRDLAIAGAVGALVVSFTVLALAWRTPRFAASRGRPVPRLGRVADSAGLAWVARLVGVALVGFGTYAALFGQDVLINPVFRMFYVLLWVGIVPASLLLGHAYKALSPVRTINLLVAKVAGTDPSEGVHRYPERLGLWPAALGLLAFVWFELVFPSYNELGPVRLWFATYLAVMLLGGVLFGDRFFARADPFEVFSSLVARLSVWGRDEDGGLVLRSPLANLSRTPVLPGLLGVVAVLFGSTSYDSFRESPVWVSFQTGYDGPVPAVLLSTAALLGFCLLAGLLFAAACAATGVRPGTSRWSLGGLFAHSLVPIVVGYFVAHYLSLFVEDGQTLVIQASDPLSNGSNLFGTADLSVSYWLSLHPTLLANIKVLGVVLGHVAGAVAAHDRALEELPRRHQLTGQLPLLAVMVVFTGGGLLLLFAA
ncbi:hypothetical protein [uncultured Nocardioides sp.]|uniref:hypothetical protein n=1 Tax=uncultured Nocardioides sp. TaxID=198441 RepID=UPI00262EA32C|nr:hypothetical protein [uncultured Nocardioides sp.]